MLPIIRTTALAALAAAAAVSAGSAGAQPAPVSKEARHGQAVTSPAGGNPRACERPVLLPRMITGPRSGPAIAWPLYLYRGGLIETTTRYGVVCFEVERLPPSHR